MKTEAEKQIRPVLNEGFPKGAAMRLFYTIGNFISYRIKTSGGSHCGGMEDVACATRRAGNLRLPGESRKRDSFLYGL